MRLGVFLGALLVAFMGVDRLVLGVDGDFGATPFAFVRPAFSLIRWILCLRALTVQSFQNNQSSCLCRMTRSEVSFEKKRSRRILALTHKLGEFFKVDGRIAGSNDANEELKLSVPSIRTHCRENVRLERGRGKGM